MRRSALLQHRLTQCVVMAAVASVAAACATASRQSADTERCTGDVELVVRNNAEGPIDVYSSAPGRPLLATVPVGTRTVLVGAQERGGGYFFYSALSPDRGKQFLGYGDRRNGGRVLFEERCLTTG